MLCWNRHTPSTSPHYYWSKYNTCWNPHKENYNSLELKEVWRLDIVELICEPTGWVNPLTIVEKPVATLWICFDPNHLNQAIRPQHYKLPIKEELFSKMHNAIFYKLHASSGYWKIKADKQLSKLLTSLTLFNSLQFRCLIYGIHNAIEVEVFQQDIKE